jgi:hypothetical protein
MPVSDKQLAANRANAAKSTGAKTPEGKRNSSRNATKHGALCHTIVLEGESCSRFAALLASFQAEFNPQTPCEQALVDTITAARWRILRLWSLETAGMSYQIRQHADAHLQETAATRASLALRHYGEGGLQQELLSRYETRFDRQFHRAVERLTGMQAERNRREKLQAPNEAITPMKTKDIPNEIDPI